MDPISAAGIGLSIASLAFQVFAGCVKGYQIFADAEGMPASYQHLRVRLRIEQTRLIAWGEKMGLVEQLLDRPSRTLQLNRNLIIDILLEIQTLFRECVRMEEKYGVLVPEKEAPGESGSTLAGVSVNEGGNANVDGAEESFERRFPKSAGAFLARTKSAIEKAPARLKWATIKQDSFRDLVEKLIGYNDSIEALLDTTALSQLQVMQQQTHMVMLQLNSKVDELKEISLAMKINSQTPAPNSLAGISRSSTLVADQKEENESFARLADFKAQQTNLEKESSGVKIVPIDEKDISLNSSKVIRPEAIYQGKPVWIEWKDYTLDHNPKSNWNQTIEDRVKRLAILLGSDHKPEEFRSPRCLGYFEDGDDGRSRYGFVYEKPGSVPAETKPVSLLDLITTEQRPSLTKRIALAHALARCLMYLHSVNWLHKGIRSSSVVFFPTPDTGAEYAAPCLSGFDYARPDFPEDITEPPVAHSENDIYRHPAVLGNSSSRSKKSHDIYSLGVVLVEIAYWQRIEEVVNLPEDHKVARSKLKKVRDMLLQTKCLDGIKGSVGEIYAEVVRNCLTGWKDLGTQGISNENDGNDGANMQQKFSDEIVQRLGNMTL